MKFLVISTLLLAATVCHGFPSSQWDMFKLKYGKTYANLEEEALRKAIWEKTLSYIEKHNAEAAEGKHTYTLGENKYADLAPQEFRQLMNGYRRQEGINGKVMESTGDIRSLPSSVDWRTAGIVTPVKDQGQCGSCWSFSATGSIEGQWALYSSKLVSLSEQNLIDCAGTQYNDYGCDGGNVESAFQYVIDNGGIDTEADYSYTAVQGPCRYSNSYKGASIRSYNRVTSGSESELKKAVAEVGPISVAIDASHQSFQTYTSGIYDPPLCSRTELDHAVLAVGYGESDGTDYWLLKNSWGTSWGMQGYFMLIRNDFNKCGVATDPSYPVV